MSAANQPPWDPDDWDFLVQQLIQQRHSACNVHRVPDDHKGDYGIDFYTTDGLLYQAYAPQTSSNLTTRLQNTKQKIRTDTWKLKKYQTNIHNVIGRITITRWILITPRQESPDLHEECSKQTPNVISWNLPFIDNNRFRVQISDLRDFDHEYRHLKQSGVLKPNLEGAEIGDAYISQYISRNNEYYKNAIRKNNKMRPTHSDGQIQSRTREHIRLYLDKASKERILRETNEPLWERFSKTQRALESQLQLYYDDIHPPANHEISEIRNKASKMIADALAGHDNYTHEMLSDGLLAEWILNCTLDIN